MQEVHSHQIKANTSTLESTVNMAACMACVRVARLDTRKCCRAHLEKTEKQLVMRVSCCREQQQQSVCLSLCAKTVMLAVPRIAQRLILAFACGLACNALGHTNVQLA